MEIHFKSAMDADEMRIGSRYSTAEGLGPQGEPGPRGDDGITPTIGANGNWYLGDMDTGMPSRGLQGEQGERGETGSRGEPGPDGATPVIGDNGNWYLGDTDTGMPSRGPQGEVGPMPVIETLTAEEIYEIMQ